MDRRGISVTHTLGVLGMILSLGLCPQRAYASSTAIFINEIHYDNTGTDASEAIEIAGPAGTDLTGWSIVLYNGSGGAIYDTYPLAGFLPDSINGFGLIVVNYPVNGLQNGSPDGIALVDAAGSVVQFLSYEGSFTVYSGPASGMTSTDIGVSEPGSEPLGHSLQLTGYGTVYEEFTWSAPADSTFGSFNHGQAFVRVLNLMAGVGKSLRGIDVGDLLIWNDDTNLFVRYLVSEPWCLTATQLQVATSVSDIPQRNGNPVPGRFEYRRRHACVADYTYSLLNSWGSLAELVTAAHADVRRVDLLTTQSAWGWGDTCRFLGKNWAACADYQTYGPFKYVFVTSTQYNGNLGGVAGADIKCQSRAAAAGRPGSFKAWISDSTADPASTFIPSGSPYVLPGLIKIANNWGDLTDGDLMHPINKDEFGGDPVYVDPIYLWPFVWSGTGYDGSKVDTLWERCNDWTATDMIYGGDVGNFMSTNYEWSAYIYTNCRYVTFPLYCFEQ